MEKNTITRQELYEMVWQESLTAISKRLKIPYTHLRRICNAMNIPVPQNGYWSKLKFGKPVAIVKLPLDFSRENEIKLYPNPQDINNSRVITLHKKTDVDFIKDLSDLPLTVPKKLTNPDKLIIAAQESLSKRAKDRYRNDGMIQTERGLLHIRVTPDNVSRALRFMDAIIKLLRARGHDVIIHYDKTYAVIDGEKFEISLMEKHNAVKSEDKWQTRQLIPSGLLSFRIDDFYGRLWIDGKVLIEEKLPNILAKLEAMSKQEKEQREYYAAQRRVQEEKERIIREQQQRIEKERFDFKNFYQHAERWHRSRFMREYLKAIEENAVEKGGLTDEVQRWICWARDKVDWYDPLINKNDILLCSVDKNKLL